MVRGGNAYTSVRGMILKYWAISRTHFKLSPFTNRTAREEDLDKVFVTEYDPRTGPDLSKGSWQEASSTIGTLFSPIPTTIAHTFVFDDQGVPQKGAQVIVKSRPVMSFRGAMRKLYLTTEANATERDNLLALPRA